MKTQTVLRVAGVIATMAGALMCFSQTAPKGKPQAAPKTIAPGTVSGRVFAITQGGDLKPARVARLYLLYSYRPDLVDKNAAQFTDADFVRAAGESPSAIFGDARLLAMHAYIEALGRDGANWSDSVVCTKELLTYNESLLKILEWNQGKTLIVFADADEEGNFKMAAPLGRYTLIARGRAGFNDAIWISKDVEVESGKETIVKLASPEKACLQR